MSKDLHLPEKVPILPGHIFTDPYKENYHKWQQLQYITNTCQQNTRFLKEDIDPNLLDTMANDLPFNLTYGQRKKPQNDYIPRVQPPWLKYDRKVLRFYGYFQEHVVQTPIQNYRLRKVVIYYYLSDQTIHVNEPRLQNSGIPQGIFIKRMKISKKLGKPQDHYKWYDFNLGISMNFNQHYIRICSCDKFTRQFFEYMGVPLNNDELIPSDSFNFYTTNKQKKIFPPDTKQYKQYVQVKMGGGHPNGGLQKYLLNDKKVLSFKIFWRDDTLQGGDNYFTLNYFLADDTTQVKQIRNQNSGKDPFPLLLNRKKLPKIPIFTHRPAMSMAKQQIYGPLDLICGKVINIYGRDCFIYDCDQYTKKYYKDNYNINQYPISLQNIKLPHSIRQIPPYNFYGSEEDSLGSVFYIQPKPPQKDIKKIFTQDQYILRFEARVISQYKDDADKKFIISFFCGDDTVSVYQSTHKNSGIWGGKFLQRKKHKNQQNDTYLNQTDFQIGNVVNLGGHHFQLIRADEFTANYMNKHPQKFPEAHFPKIVQKIRLYSTKYNSYDDFLMDIIKSYFQQIGIDPQKKGSVSFNRVKQGFDSLGIDLNWQECYMICRQSKTGQQFNVGMQNLWKCLGGKIQKK